LRAVLQVFRTLGYSESEAVVRQLIEHPVHDVRWDAMKTLFQLNSEVGIAALEHAAHDSHPHVRRAAEKSLLSFAQRRNPATEVTR
jgi:HEAT repeats